MKRSVVRVGLLSCLTLCAGGTLAWAGPGIVAVERTTSGGVTTTGQVHMTAQHMRADVFDGDGRRQSVVFDGVKQVLWVIDLERKSYLEMTKADVDQLGAQLPALMAMAQQMLQNMPPEQRAKIDQMMRGRGLSLPPAGASMKPEYRKGGSQKSGAWTCDVYEMFVAGQRVGDMCTVPPKTLGFVAADFEVSKRLSAFLQGLMPGAASGVFQLGEGGDQGFSGVPVRRTTSVAGRESVSELRSLKRQEVPDATFYVPEGFQKQPFTGLGALGGRGRP